MGPTFGGFLIANGFWAPWSAVGARFAKWCGRIHGPALLNDGACQACTATAAAPLRSDEESATSHVSSTGPARCAHTSPEQAVDYGSRSTLMLAASSR
jgi:hypothetical protein